MTKCIALIALIASLAGCKTQIPNSVTADEYAIYSAWLNHYFSRHAPSNLYLRSRTFEFPTESGGCTNKMMQKAGVPLSLINPLRELGDAQYRLDFDYPKKKLIIPWNYKVADEWELIPEERLQFKWVGFSRVAFNRAHDKALFAVMDVCGGLCGKGGSVYAHKENGAWCLKMPVVFGCIDSAHRFERARKAGMSLTSSSPPKRQAIRKFTCAARKSESLLA
jgi:hypothetical protein